MPHRSFEDLDVYRLAEDLADHVWDIVASWHRFAQNTIGGQLVRAADGIGANIAEGTGRGSFQDNRRFVKIARGSLYESRHWLRRAYRRKLLTEEHVALLKPLLDELAPRLNAYLKSIGSHRSAGRAANDSRRSGHPSDGIQ
jgi:four helix bundle protein